MEEDEDFELEPALQDFLNSNPELVKQIKTAATIAGVAVIVATLLENLSVVGVADDPASFYLAYKLITLSIGP